MCVLNRTGDREIDLRLEGAGIAKEQEDLFLILFCPA